MTLSKDDLEAIETLLDRKFDDFYTKLDIDNLTFKLESDMKILKLQIQQFASKPVVSGGFIDGLSVALGNEPRMDSIEWETLESAYSNGRAPKNNASYYR